VWEALTTPRSLASPAAAGRDWPEHVAAHTNTPLRIAATFLIGPVLSHLLPLES
jgi:hypothetical protein